MWKPWQLGYDLNQTYSVAASLITCYLRVKSSWWFVMANFRAYCTVLFEILSSVCNYLPCDCLSMWPVFVGWLAAIIWIKQGIVNIESVMDTTLVHTDNLMQKSASMVGIRKNTKVCKYTYDFVLFVLIVMIFSKITLTMANLIKRVHHFYHQILHSVKCTSNNRSHWHSMCYEIIMKWNEKISTMTAYEVKCSRNTKRFCIYNNSDVICCVDTLIIPLFVLFDLICNLMWSSTTWLIMQKDQWILSNLNILYKPMQVI